MDNLDGKQARKTGTSSPLGELFDHGCDSLFLLLCSTSVSPALDLTHWETFLMCSFGVLAFYGSHWEEFHTNHFIMGRYANPTEVQCGMMVLLIVSANFGPSIWSVELFRIKALNLIIYRKTIAIYSTVFACFFKLLENGYKTIILARQNNRSVFSAISPIIPMIIHSTSMFVWVLTSPTNILENHFLLVMFMGCVIFSALCDWLVICRITKMEFVVPNPILLFSIAGALVAVSKLPDTIPLYCLGSVLGVVYVYFIVCVVLQLSHHLDINVFTIPKKTS